MGVKLISYKDRSANKMLTNRNPRRPSRSDMQGITRALRKLHNDGLKNLCFLQSSIRIITKTG